MTDHERWEQAVAAFDQLVDRFGDDPNLQEQVAWALTNKGATLRQLGRVEDEVRLRRTGRPLRRRPAGVPAAGRQGAALQGGPAR
jgi:hypothetical protein